MGIDDFATREEAFEDAENEPTNAQLERALGAVIAARYSRRAVLGGLLAVPVVEAIVAGAPVAAQDTAAPAAAHRAATHTRPTADFKEVAAGVDATHHVAEGYEVQVVMRWGDPLAPDLAPFDPRRLTGDDQRRRFGYNNDYLAFFPLQADAKRGLLCSNHEYTSAEMMFPGLGARRRGDFAGMDRAKVDVEIAAHGCGVVEIAFGPGGWAPVLDSRFNRRITADTPMSADGPAAGHARLKTKADPTGQNILGTFNNCAGGITPWGTYLTAEENFNGYFMTDVRSADNKRVTRGLGGADQTRWERYAIPSNWYTWGSFHDRFHVDKEPNEANRHGWIVEINPRDPTSTPVKHTALGRFRHEGAETFVNTDGRLVVYSGDDAVFEYVYRYVSTGKVDPANPAANRTLLSDGVLSVARFDADGTGVWLPLIHGQGPLTTANGFADQAEVLIYARMAADALKATPMDRPEDVQVNPKTGKVMVMLTNNPRRTRAETNGVNPRADNRFGHIVEIEPPQHDHGAPTFKWDILVRCGDPAVAAVGALWHPATTTDGWFASPDNVAFDAEGRMWISTDQGHAATRAGRAEGLYQVEGEGSGRGTSRLFFRAPMGAEVCGPCFTPDGETLFLAIQHPGVDGAREWQPFGRDPHFDDPPTRWPDFKSDMPPRPSVIAIRRTGGGRIG